MKNAHKWKPSKYINKNGKLAASTDPKEVGVASRLMADCIADAYNSYLKTYACGRLIDLGCGKVPLYEAYRNIVSDNVCVDWENTIHRNDYLDFACDLSQPLPFQDNQFDTAILSDVLEHIPEPLLLLQEINRILVHGGNAIINIPFFYSLHETPHDYYRYTEYAIRYLAVKSHFKVMMLKPIGGVPEILTDILAKQLIRVRYIGVFLSKTVQYIAKTFLRTSVGKNISSATSQNFPLGYFIVLKKH